MRLVYFSPKQEGFIDLLPKDKKKRPIGLVGSVDGMLKNPLDRDWETNQ